MQYHNLQSPDRKRKRRIGRGGKRGTYSGRGMKGQKSRAGRKMRPELRDIIKKIPKKRGYRMSVPKHIIAEVSIRTLEKSMKDGETVTPKILIERGIIHARGNKMPEIKILGSENLTKKLIVKGCKTSKGARKAIEKAGGSIIEKSK